MTEKEQVNLNLLMVEFRQMQKDIGGLKASSTLMEEIASMLVQFKKQFEPGNGLVNRLVMAVSDEWRKEFTAFTKKTDDTLETLPCRNLKLGDDGSMKSGCRIVDEGYHLKPDEKEIKS